MNGAVLRTALLALRVAAGTALFAIVLIAVQSSDPRVAGMMMAFPAVNGISLLMAPVENKTAMARAMLPVIALNGWMAMAFIAVFGLLAAMSSENAVGLIWMLSAAAFTAWILLIAVFTRVPASIDRMFLAAFLIASPFLIIGLSNCNGSATPPSGGLSPAAAAWRIGLFAVTLSLLLWIADRFSAGHAVLGRLGAFPLLPLFSLATVARSGETPQEGLQKLLALRPAFLAGILIAMAFAIVFAGFLDFHRRRTASSGRSWKVATTALVAGWLLCGGVIWLLGHAAGLLHADTAPTGCT